jgi:hypothetical protein
MKRMITRIQSSSPGDSGLIVADILVGLSQSRIRYVGHLAEAAAARNGEQDKKVCVLGKP